MRTGTATAGRVDAIAKPKAPPIGIQRGIALGFLAMVPLFVVYELTLRASGGRVHNAAEIVLTLPLALFGTHADVARVVVLLVCTIAAGWSCFHTQLGLVTRLGRILFEGALGAVLLGPFLLLLQHVLALKEPLALSAVSAVPPIAQGFLHFSSAAFEEILFRVGLQSALYVLALELVLFFADSHVIARVVAEIGSILLAAFVFAAAHLSVFVRTLGSGGEAFDPSIFAWRVLAGVALGVLFRWRGPGVAAWTHGLFNLALFIGAGPDVFL